MYFDFNNRDIRIHVGNVLVNNSIHGRNNFAALNIYIKVVFLNFSMNFHLVHKISHVLMRVVTRRIFK